MNHEEGKRKKEKSSLRGGIRRGGWQSKSAFVATVDCHVIRPAADSLQ